MISTNILNYLQKNNLIQKTPTQSCCDNPIIEQAYTEAKKCSTCGAYAYSNTDYFFDYTTSNSYLKNAGINFKITNTLFNYGKKSKLNILQKWNDLKYSDRIILEIFKEYDELSVKYDIPKAGIDNAKNYFIKIKHIQENKKNLIFRGKNKIGLKAICLYY